MMKLRPTIAFLFGCVIFTPSCSLPIENLNTLKNDLKQSSTEASNHINPEIKPSSAKPNVSQPLPSAKQNTPPPEITKPLPTPPIPQATARITILPEPMLSPTPLPEQKINLETLKGKIVFNTVFKGKWVIVTGKANGSQMKQITDNSVIANDREPKWSPDGKKIVFTSSRDSESLKEEIYSMNADGSQQTRLTNHAARDTQPSWAPDGRITFITDRNGKPETYIMKADGSNQGRLSKIAGIPIWLNNRVKILYQSDTDKELYSAYEDGSEPIKITNIAQNISSPFSSVISPDSKKIAFTISKTYPYEKDPKYTVNIYELRIMDVDGTNQKQWSNKEGNISFPTWSPDGNYLLFTRNSEFFVANTDGSSQTLIPSHPYPADAAHWVADE